MQVVVPTMRITSCVTSKAFYERIGFIEAWTHPFEPGLPVFAAVARAGMEIFLTEHTGDCAFGARVHFYVEDVDAPHTEFLRSGVAGCEPPNDGPGADLRSRTLRDPDVNRLKFLTQS